MNPPRLLRSIGAASTLCLLSGHLRADTATVAADAQSVISNASTASYTLTLSNAKTWSNLPGFSRNGPTLGGGAKSLSTDLSGTAQTAALTLAADALSSAGYTTMNEIRLGDEVIRSSSSVGGFDWNYSNYHVAVLGTPSTSTPFILQFGGHHLALNLTYNGPYTSATPMFLGTEPVKYYRLPTSNATYPNYAVVVGKVNGTTNYYITNPDKTANGSSSNVTITTTDPGISSATAHAPLETQRAAVAALATSLQADSANASAAKLSGTYSDVVMGVTNSGDGNFPFIGTNPTYPTGTSGRGVLYGSLTATEQAQVKAVIEAWVNVLNADTANPLLDDYESDAALAATYVGYQVGSGSADGGATRANFDADVYTETTPVNSQNSYLRIDGPRVWIEFVVQASVAYNAQKWVHYHTLYRDRLADYGNEFGGYLDTTSTSTTYTRPTITAQPGSYTGSSATFSVAASGTGPLSYQWYDSAGGISGATGASYTTATSGSYYAVVSNLYGTTASSVGTLNGSSGGTSGAAPVLTCSGAVSVGQGEPFAYGITATNTPTTFAASNLPPGTNFDAASGLIAGFVPTAGTYIVNISATNAYGTSAASFALTVTAADAPVLTSSGAVSVGAGQPFAYGITATNSPTTFTASNLPPGTNFDADRGLIAGFVPTAGTYIVNISASNAGGTSAATFELTVTP